MKKGSRLGKGPKLCSAKPSPPFVWSLAKSPAPDIVLANGIYAMTAPAAASKRPANEPAPMTATPLPADEAAEVALAAADEAPDEAADLTEEAAEVTEALAPEADCTRCKG